MKSHAEPKVDHRQARGDVTRQAMMRAAEKLIAENGIENVTIRLILTEAGQKNTSALQYHFRNLKGLIAAVHAQRSRGIQARRAELLAALLETTDSPSLRDLCKLMIRPLFELSREEVGYRRYVKAFGHELALLDSSALGRVGRQGGGGDSGVRLAGLLRETLTELDDDAFRRRMEFAVRYCSAAMYQQARVANAFRGPEAELFLSTLIDSLTGLLGAEESDETRAVARTLKSR